MSSIVATPRGDRWSRRFTYLDAFPKVERNITNASGSGGVVSILVTVLLVYLVVSELLNWISLKQEFEYLVDQTPTSSSSVGLLINVDLTVAMPCNSRSYPFASPLWESKEWAWLKQRASQHIALRVDVMDVSQTSVHIEQFKMLDVSIP